MDHGSGFGANPAQSGKFWTMDFGISILLLLLAGAGVSVMVQLNALLGQEIGVFLSSFWVHVVGTGAAFLLLLGLRRFSGFRRIPGTPPMLFTGGALGMLVVALSNWIVPQVGISLGMALFVSGGILVSIWMDHKGILSPKMPITGSRLVGAGLALLGCLLILFH